VRRSKRGRRKPPPKQDDPTRGERDARDDAAPKKNEGFFVTCFAARHDVPAAIRDSGLRQRYPPIMEPCPQCGDPVWGFMQPSKGGVVPTQPAGVSSSYVVLFPCEHRVWLPVTQPMSV